MPKDVVLPELAESVVEGEIVTWLVETGARVVVHQPLVEVMTDKVTVELPSPFAGTLVEQVAAVGDVVMVGAVLARIEEAGAAPAAAAEASSSAHTRAAVPAAAGEDRGDARSLFRAQTPSPGSPLLQVRRRSNTGASPPAATRSSLGSARDTGAGAAAAGPRGPFGRVVAVPAARRLARDLGVPIEAVLGSGPSGRVRVADVERHTQAGTSGDASGFPAPPRYLTPEGFETLETRVALRGRRRAVAQQLAASHLHTVRTLHVDEADVSALVQVRDTLRPRAEARGAKLSYLPFVMKAVTHALRAFPELNSSLDEVRQEVVFKDYVNLGMAVATDAGLLVPVLQRADERSLLELALESQRLADLARRDALSPEDVRGHSFTISNVGSLGGLFSFPIINAPDAAILGVHTVKKRPVVLPDDSIAARPMLYLSLSFDHRLVDGAAAVRFTTHVIDLLETPEALLLER